MENRNLIKTNSKTPMGSASQFQSHSLCQSVNQFTTKCSPTQQGRTKRKGEQEKERQIKREKERQGKRCDKVRQVSSLPEVANAAI